MTILPKKKAGQAKSEPENSEPVQHHGGGHLQNISSQDSLNRERIYSGPRTSPPRWSRESSSADYDDYFERLDTSAGPCHSSSKRGRHSHRASPHRNVSRNKGHGHLGHLRSGASPQTSSASFLPANVANHGLANQSDSQDSTNESTKAASVSMQEIEEDHTGYNSGDEYGPPPGTYAWSAEEWEEREKHFEKKMRKKGFIIKQMCEDGACLFRAVADQVYGDQEMNSSVRNNCMDYMLKNSDYYSQYVTEDFKQYVKRKRKDNIHGNHIEIQALSEMYNRPIQIYHYSNEPINTFHAMHQTTEDEPIRLSYHKNTHYNSIVNPYKATVGVGLGLPAFKPGLAEKNLMRDAKDLSEQFQLEQTMLEDKLKATDWEATNEAIEEQVARESYLQWLKDNEKRANKTNRSSTATSSAGSSAMDGAGGTPGRTSPRTRSRNSPNNELSQHPSHDHRGSPIASGSGFGNISSSNSTSPSKNNNNNSNSSSSAVNVDSQYDFHLLETSSFLNQNPPSMFGLTEWDDADILAQVLAVSQQEYLDRLKQESNNVDHNKHGGS